MIRCVETGRNPTMRYLHRTHRVSVAWIHECFERDDMRLVYELTAKMCADIYTKAFTDTTKWQAACWLINVVDPAQLKNYLRHVNDLDMNDDTIPQQHSHNDNDKSYKSPSFGGGGGTQDNIGYS